MANVPQEIARLMQTVAVSEDCPRQAELDQRLEETRRRERETAWKATFLKHAPLRGTEAAWQPKPTFATSAVFEWLANGDGQHLMLRGGVGSGKSTAAACAVKHWTEPGTDRGSVVWLKPDQLTSAVLHGYDPSAPKLARHVVLDDIGRETKVNFEEAWCDLLERRDHVVVMTTNLTKKQLRERYDLRVIERLIATTRAVDVPGRSMRRGGDF